MPTKKIIGRIIPFSRGEYDATYNYDVLDQVQSGTAIYQSRKPNNLGHAVTDKEWWTKYFDVGAAIEAATSQETPEAQSGAVVRRIMAIDQNGQPCSITPAVLVNYVLENLLSYDLLAIERNNNDD